MKLLTKCAVIAFVIILFIFSCQKDDVATNEQQLIETGISLKTLSIDEIEGLQPVVNNIKKLTPKIPIGMQARDFSFLSLDSLDLDNIVEYTDTTGYSTWTIKFNGSEDSINFENLHLLETDDGYLAYILSYEPEENWYYSDANITPEGDWVLHMDSYEGHISKYSLERELIWSSNPVIN